MNGTGRIVLIMMLRIEKTHLFSKKFPFLVTYKSKPRGIPRIVANISVTITIKRVSPVASSMRGKIYSINSHELLPPSAALAVLDVVMLFEFPSAHLAILQADFQIAHFEVQ